MDKPIKKAAVKPKANKVVIPKIDVAQVCGDNSSYAYITSGGKFISQYKDVCFARFNVYAASAKPEHQGIVKGKLYIAPVKMSTDKKLFVLQRRYIHWVIKRSPFRFAFKNTKKNFWKDGVDINCNMPHPYVVGAMIAVRESWEFSERVIRWTNLQKKAGISPELAFYLVNSVQKDRLEPAGHATIQAPASWNKGTIAWFKHLTEEEILKQWPTPLYKEATYYHGVSAWLVTPKEKGLPFLQWIKPYSVEKGQGWDKYTSINLFDEKVLPKLKELDYA